jgi:tyrosyl-tRNA synthetase
MLFGSKPPVSTDEDKIDEILSRGVHEIVPSKESLKKLLMSGRRLRIKLGVDPTSPNIHLGRSVPLLKLRDFQELGHQVVFIVGDFTAVIGDTSDKESERPMLSRETIANNMQTYREQVGKIINLARAEFRKNSEWLEKLTYREISEHANIFSVADFVARDNIKKRLREGRRVSLREVLYPLMQGYDSVAVRADVELGGSDQRFNVLAGRPLQEHFNQDPQHCLLFSLVTDPSGKKMSSSWGNTINIIDSPEDMFGKAMAISDAMTEQYFIAMTRVPHGTVRELLAGHPKEAKMALAEELVRMYHGEQPAQKARENFEKTFAQRGIPEDVPEVGAAPTLVETLVKSKAVESNSEVRRLVGQGAITHMDSGEKVTDINGLPKEGVYRIGKHRFVKITK